MKQHPSQEELNLQPYSCLQFKSDQSTVV